MNASRTEIAHTAGSGLRAGNVSMGVSSEVRVARGIVGTEAPDREAASLN